MTPENYVFESWLTTLIKAIFDLLPSQGSSKDVNNSFDIRFAPGEQLQVRKKLGLRKAGQLLLNYVQIMNS